MTLELTAVFESWHIGDGNYPPFHRGQLVRLSFELETTRLESAAESGAPRFEATGDAEYSGRGRVLRCYGHGAESIAIVEAGDFRFYVHGPRARKLVRDTSVEFDGTLLLDHYLWVEFLRDYADPPDLFYSLRVTRIRKVAIPDRFVRRGARSISSPTRVGPKDFGPVQEVDAMGEVDAMQEFYLVDFDDKGLEGIEVARTFQ